MPLDGGKYPEVPRRKDKIPIEQRFNFAERDRQKNERIDQNKNFWFNQKDSAENQIKEAGKDQVQEVEISALSGSPKNSFHQIREDVYEELRASIKANGLVYESATAIGEKAATFTISKAKLTPNVVSVESKIYDGTTTATGTISLTGAVDGEQPTATGAFTWTSANAGTTGVNVSDMVLANNWDKNYTLATTSFSGITAPAGATITKAILIPSIKTIDSKHYDGTTNAAGTIQLSGVQNNENPEIEYTLNWTNANAGTNQVKAENLRLFDNWGTNYELSAATLPVTIAPNDSKIEKAVLTPVLTQASSKPYDGTTKAAGTISLTGAQNNEKPSVTSDIAWAAASAGTNLMDVTNIQLTGPWDQNYTLATPSLSNVAAPDGAVISKALLIPSVSSVSQKTYDNTTTATGTIALAGAVKGEIPTATASFQWTSAAAGTDSLNVSAIQLEDTWSNNYELTATNLSNVTAPNGLTIAKALLTPVLFSVDNKTYDGNKAATGTIKYQGQTYGTDQIQVQGTIEWGSPTAETNTVNVKNMYLTGEGSSNYSLTQAAFSNVLTPNGTKISKATLTPYLESLQSKPYDGTTNAVGVIGFTGAQNNEMPDITYDLQWSSIAVGTKIVKVSGFTLNGVFQLNYSPLEDAAFNTEETITPATVTVTAQPAATVDVTEGKIIGSIETAASASYAAANIQYQWYSCTSANKENAAPIASENKEAFAIPTAQAAGTYYCFCRISADGALPVDTNTTTIRVLPDAPVGIAQQQESVIEKKDGTLTGVDSTMEYNDGSGWKDITGTSITGFSNEAVQVRCKAHDTVPSGIISTFTFAPSVNFLSFTFDSEGGSKRVALALSYNALAQKPKDPEKDGFRFDGWFTTGNRAWDFAADHVTEATTVYAKWTLLPVSDNMAASLVRGDGNDWSDTTKAILTAPTGYHVSLDQQSWSQSVTLPMSDYAGKTVTYYLTYVVSGAVSDVRTVKVPKVKVLAPEVGTTVTGATANTDDLTEKALTAADQQALNNGATVTLQLRVDQITPTEEDKAAIEKVLEEGTTGLFLDVSIIKTVDGTESHVTDLSKPIRITVPIPADLLNSGRTFAVLRLHDGSVATLPDLDADPNTYTFETDKFSTYSLAYTDAAIPADTTPTVKKQPKTGDVMQISFYAALGSASALGMIFLLLEHKKKSRHI